MATTTAIRSWWAPPCTGPFVKVALYGRGVVSVRPEIVDATHALSSCFEAHKYQTRAADTGAYNCRVITGGSGYSLHAYGVAIDVNWLSNPYGSALVTDMPKALIADVKAIRTRNGKQVWRWGGDYTGNRDAMHFETVAHPNDLATGIDPATLPRAKPAPSPLPKDPFMALTDAEQREILEHLRHLDPWPAEKLNTNGQPDPVHGKPAARHLRWISETVQKIRKL